MEKRKTRPLRVGMAGLASMWWPIAIAQGLAAAKGAKLLAAATLGASKKEVVDILGMDPETYARRFSAKLYRSAEEMIEEEKLDAVVLNIRHSRHADWTERLAALGVDIYIPKSFATTLADAERIVNAGEAFGVNIACGPSDRYQPAILAAKKAIDGGRIGSVLSVRLAHHHGTIEAFHKNDWYRDEKEGGPELSLGWYVVDLAMHLCGSRPVFVFADYRNYTTKASPFMDCGKMFLRMASGAMVSCDMYFCNRFPYPGWELELVGSKGVVKVQAPALDRTTASLYTAKGIEPLSLPKKPPDRETAWVEGFRKGEPAVVSAREALEITQVSLAARDSTLTGKAIFLDGPV